MHSKRGISLIEVIVVIVILTIGIVGTYGILDGGQKLAFTTENRIKAINIAREGLEAVQNIRDTNRIKFSSDYTHCWNTYNYDDGCIGVPTGHRIAAGSYILTQDASYNWKLSNPPIVPSTTYTVYMGQFPVSYDADGLITQTTSATKCTSTNSKSCLSIFSREIQILYPDTNNPETSSQMEIHSIVKWRDNSKDGVYTINIPTTITNWKKGN